MSPLLPPVTGRELIRALERTGFETVRISGSHHRLVHASDASRAVTIPVHGAKPLKRGTLQSVLRQAGLTASELLVLLKA
jgi:predicted RNA binding protein YcfA (HicA-like mRNA interferase family)